MLTQCFHFSFTGYLAGRNRWITPFFDIEKETRYGIKNMIHAAIRMREAIPPQ